MTFDTTTDCAARLDHKDGLALYREQFHLPERADGTPYIYMCGNSLGLQPKSTSQQIQQELIDWQKLGVEGHFHAKIPWLPYHEFLTEAMARVVGAKPHEVVVMNTLTVNLHMMLVSFYRPSGTRNKVIIEADAFPSDKYAVQSQMRWHGLDPEECLVEMKARQGEVCLRPEDIKTYIDDCGDQLALVMLGNTNYYTGQYYNIHDITRWAQAQGSLVGFDCAHAAGNIALDLHGSGCDFAVWCNYKYLNAGPGGMGGIFVHERHHNDPKIPRLEGWWGHNKETRFKMRDDFEPIPTAEAWQLSNPPIMAMASVWASLQIFDEVGMKALRQKSQQLTAYLEYLVDSLGEDVVDIITPRDPAQRGAQLSIRVKSANKEVYDRVIDQGVIADWREPDVIRVAPAPLYNSYQDVYQLYAALRDAIRS